MRSMKHCPQHMVQLVCECATALCLRLYCAVLAKRFKVIRLAHYTLRYHKKASAFGMSFKLLDAFCFLADCLSTLNNLVARKFAIPNECGIWCIRSSNNREKLI